MNAFSLHVTAIFLKTVTPFQVYLSRRTEVWRNEKLVKQLKPLFVRPVLLRPLYISCKLERLHRCCCFASKLAIIYSGCGRYLRYKEPALFSAASPTRHGECYKLLLFHVDPYAITACFGAVLFA